MRLFLASLVIIIGTTIGVNAINTVSNLQDSKLQRFCKQIPIGSSYDEMCNSYK